MIRNLIYLGISLSLSACMAGAGPAPVEYKGASSTGAAEIPKAQTPASLPEFHVADSNEAILPDNTENLSEAEELDMLDVEPAPYSNGTDTAKPPVEDVSPGAIDQGLTTEEELDMLDVEPGSPAPVELNPDIDTVPPQTVEQSSISPPVDTLNSQAEQVQIVRTKDRPASVIIKSGDTLFSLSEKYQVALEPLIKLNKLKKPYALNKGQVLKLPAPLHYRVQKGDTLYAISRKYNIHFQSLANINGIEEPFVISPNTILVLPALARDSDGKWKAAPSKAAEPVANNGGAVAPKTVSKPLKPASNSTFIWPLKGKIISRFGGKAGGMRNDGINIAADPMAEVVAARAGTVIYSGSELKNFGRLILIRHNNGWVTAYAHNSANKVLEGAEVTQGQVIALAGSSGSVDVSQLHFETRKGVKPVDPLKHLPKL